MTNNIKIEPARGPAVWTGAEMQKRDDWIHRLPKDALAAIDAVIQRCRAGEIDQFNLPLDAFDDPAIKAAFAPAREALKSGCGFALVKGIDAGRYDKDEMETIHWGLGNMLGIGMPHGKNDERIGHVIDTEARSERTYYYHVGGPLPMHMDPADVAGLMCLRMAKSGGDSLLASSGAVHNAILAERPELLAQLYRGYYHHTRAGDGVKETDALTKDRLPIFAQLDGVTSCSYLPSPILRAVSMSGVELTEIESGALEILNEVAARPEMTINMPIESGDIQYVNNRLILHGRADYEDWPEMERRRHLLRVWFTVPDFPEIPPMYHFDAERGPDGKTIMHYVPGEALVAS